MDDEVNLLDTPKRKHLQSQSSELRTALKQFERAFTEQHGYKPKQPDIKNDAVIAAKYKQYHRVQDVLTGKLPFENLGDVAVKRQRNQNNSRHSSNVVGSSPRKKQRLRTTPRKPQHGEVNDVTYSSPILCTAIGPTPHRDGKVLGLFDLLQSGSKQSVTPSSSVRKRKIEELYSDTPLYTDIARSPLKSMQTPSQRQRSPKKQSDLLDHLTGTPQKSTGTHPGKLSRTPQSHGKKFELSKFFATPSTQRFLFPDAALNGATPEKTTPLRDMVLGKTPVQDIKEKGLDKTPQYLRRSTSFKDRLLSASQPASGTNTAKSSPVVRRIGPPTLRHFRSSTSVIPRLPNIQLNQSEPRRPPPSPPPITQDDNDNDHNDDYDDDLDALRELEGGSPPPPAQSPHVLVEDSQLNFDDNPSEFPSSPNPSVTEVKDHPITQSTKTYKKKGQKRTTRKANIRVAATSSTKAFIEPKFVAADGDSDAEDDRDEIIEETRLMDDGDEFDDDDDDDDDEFNDDDDEEIQDKRSNAKAKDQGSKAGKDKDPKTSSGKSTKRKAGTINPNAQSHMNFRSLKIKNKNSKAKAGAGGGRGKFGKGGRSRGF